MLLNMGIEGTHYTMQDGEPIFTDYILNNPDGLSPKQAVGTFTIAQGTMPSVLCFGETSQLDDAAVLEAKENCIIPFLEESNKYVIPGTAFVLILRKTPSAVPPWRISRPMWTRWS